MSTIWSVCVYMTGSCGKHYQHVVAADGERLGGAQTFTDGPGTAHHQYSRTWWSTFQGTRPKQTQSVLFCASCSCTAEAMVVYLSSVFSMYIILWRFAPSQAIVLCFRLHFTKDNITNNTAAATVRQVVTVVFERMVAEDERFKGQRMSQL